MGPLITTHAIVICNALLSHAQHNITDAYTACALSNWFILNYLAFECVHLTRYLSGDTNDAASGTQTSVTGLEGVWVSSLAEVIGAGVDDDGALYVLAFCLLLSPRPLNSEKVAWEGRREIGAWEHSQREDLRR